MAQALIEHDAGELLRLVRQFAGASQHAIGAAVDMPQPHVSVIMRGRREISALRTWQRIADGLGMPDESRRLLGLADSAITHVGGIGASGVAPADSGDLWSASSTLLDISENTLKDLMKRREALRTGGRVDCRRGADGDVRALAAAKPWPRSPRQQGHRGRRTPANRGD
ncbi:helix-turn-helix domain-containing protein [Salinactinospora qingdaonensis]|uniref:helix-turn-helix domain-containing protein n=1 Tax=Salinactinospora qingdaonensis TaxID=702744 RepID=UPI0031EAFB38